VYQYVQPRPAGYKQLSRPCKIVNDL